MSIELFLDYIKIMLLALIYYELRYGGYEDDDDSDDDDGDVEHVK